MVATVQEDLVAGLEGFSGQVLRSADAGYDEARRIHNGLIDKRPAIIARCLGTADVVAAVNVARDQGLELSVRGGGHNVAGKAVTDGGVMVDLSLMKGIHVDPAASTVRAQGGVTWAELNRETQVHGLAVTGGVVSTTGIAGLTLGGGFGWTMSKTGLAVDNLISAEVVTADGSVLTASESEHADLFWGLRGGGGNFGVVTWFEYRLQPVGPIVTGGLIAHPLEAAGDVLRFARDQIPNLPDELVVFPVLVHSPDGAAKLAAFLIGHVGSAEQAERDMAPWLEFGSPLDVQVGPMPYTVAQLAPRRRLPEGRAELLEGRVPLRAERRGHRHDGGAVRGLPLADVGDRARALPGPGGARSGRRHGRSSPCAGHQPQHRLGLDGSRGDRREHRLDAGHLRRRATVACRGCATSTTSATTSPGRIRSEGRTGRTTTGSSS